MELVGSIHRTSVAGGECTIDRVWHVDVKTAAPVPTRVFGDTGETFYFNFFSPVPVWPGYPQWSDLLPVDASGYATEHEVCPGEAPTDRSCQVNGVFPARIAAMHDGTW
jgi:hypothetical protein